MYKPLIKPTTIKVLWLCHHCDETYLMYQPVRSRKLCPNCKRSMAIDKTVEE